MRILLTLSMVFVSVVIQAQKSTITVSDHNASEQKAAEVKIDHENRKITFSKSTQYEIYDQFKNLVLKGEETVVHVWRYCDRNTRYYLHYNNETVEFHFMKPSVNRRK